MTVAQLEEHLPAGYHFVLDADFVNVKTGRTMKLAEWHGHVWLFYKHPDGKWVSLREATVADVVAVCEAARS